MSLVALVLAIIGIVVLLMGNLLHRKAWMHLGNAERGLAALARVQGRPDEAARHEARADGFARRAWPFTVRPQTTFEVPGYLVTVDEKLTEEQVAEFVERWREASDLGHAARYAILPPQPRRRWWQRKGRP